MHTLYVVKNQIVVVFFFQNASKFRKATMCFLAFVGLYSILRLFYQYRVAFLLSSNFKTMAAKLTSPSEKVAGAVQNKWNYTGSFYTEYPQFAPKLNSMEYAWYMQLISVFKYQCEAYNITFYIDFGSLLGA